MLGGYQILDLRNIDLTRGTSASNITNAYVLNQLLKLREHIEKSYNFSKALNNQLKPVLIRYRDKKNGEKHESAVFGALEVVNTYYKFKIVAENNGERLSIDVEFEEKTYENDEKYWDIKTAKILLESAKTVLSNTLADGDIENAKPLFWHSLDIYKSGKTLLRAVIINNDDTPINSMQKLMDWFDSHPSGSSIDLLLNGAYTDPSDVYHLDVVSVRHTTGAENNYVFYFNLQGTAGYSSVIVSPTDLLAQEISVGDTNINKLN